ncbi:polysaccharide biosynthesis/export family protein [Chryseobacterium sp.]|uniref:polysaccharide biosynthesis/export family protein n=1 Tax=Chryseobacterium sp. TaxID=1871047 RepID=UPI0012A9993D|nr:polysaccharide biosynthesis/export family protein [Chryseobacterium sp.]QFG53757.1 polysaccharide export protein [Chryseobacterium sp.]
MMKNSIYFLLLLLALSSCKPKENMVYMDTDRALAEQQVQQAVFEGSRLQTGDLLDIKVTAFDEYAVRPFNLHSMNQVSTPAESQNTQAAQTAPQGYVIDNEGYLTFPVLGRIFVKGMTMAQLRTDLEQRLRQYLSDPLVSIRQLNFNVTVLGEVKSPGQYTSATDKVTVFQALGMAGDMTDYGDRTKVRLIRHEANGDATYVLDFTDKNITSSPYYYLQQNDVLYVEPDDIKKKSANVDPNRNLAFQIGGVVLGLASILITLLR